MFAADDGFPTTSSSLAVLYFYLNYFGQMNARLRYLRSRLVANDHLDRANLHLCRKILNSNANW
jgi:hypothetical protein